jgi:hypothetical protein
MYNIEIMPLKKDIYQSPTEYDFLPFENMWVVFLT